MKGLNASPKVKQLGRVPEPRGESSPGPDYRAGAPNPSASLPPSRQQTLASLCLPVLINKMGWRCCPTCL